MIWIILAPLAAALAAPLLQRAAGRLTGTVLAAAPLGILLYTLANLPDVAHPSRETVLAWLPDLGVSLSLRLDGWSALFVMLITGIGALILIYSDGYMAGKPRRGEFFAYLMLFMAAMLGIVISDDYILLFVFWELTTLSSFLLIGFEHESEEARQAALKSLLITSGAGLALLAGLLLLWIMAAQQGLPADQATRLSALTRIHPREHPLYPLALVLIVVGCFGKSAQMPLHFWLPAAMTAPTPVSAYLHSATMVNAGIYLLARLNPALGGTPQWFMLLTLGGAVTMLVAAVMSAGRRDLKQILAYATISVLGILVMLIGIGTEQAVKAAVVYLTAHALYKAALFMVAGNIDHAVGSRDVTRLGKLFWAMPISAVAALIAAMSQAGAPPMFGFLGKELLLKAKLDLQSIGTFLMVVATVANIFLVAVALLVAFWPFFGRRPQPLPREPHEARFTMLVGPVVLACLSLFAGLVPGLFDATLGPAAASSIVGRPVDMHLKLWHGLNTESLIIMATSAVTLLLGFLLFVKLHRWLEPLLRTVQFLGRWGPSAAYARGLQGLFGGAGWLTGVLQSGYLRRYLLVILTTTVALAIWPLLNALRPQWSNVMWSVRVHEIVIASATLAGALVAVITTSRLTAIIALGVTGLGMAVTFGFFGAPDLAITQVMVEVLTVILLALALHHLPEVSKRRTLRQRRRDALLAGVLGAFMTLLIIASASTDYPWFISSYYAQVAVPEAHAHNLVNAILVDFRAMDTWGETTVIATAGIGGYALLRYRPHRKRRKPS